MRSAIAPGPSSDWPTGWDWPADPGFGLYVHWPFCAAKCPYCDFNSHVAGRVDDGAWRDALLGEMARMAALTGPRPLRSIFFGGGTPSLMPASTAAAIIEAAVAYWPPEPGMEITLEANPGSVEAARFAGYRSAGVNRVSIGVQSLVDADLRRLGRLHGAEEARDAVKIAAGIFDRISVDLIYARQDQTIAEWRRELGEALAFGTEHLSLYQLTIEPGTAFGARHAAGRLSGLPDADLAADLFELTQELCDRAGLSSYETSNHARPGAACRHNLIYWQAGDYAGVGPGAHGRLTIGTGRVATAALAAPDRWLARAGTAAATGDEVLSAEDAAIEALLMGIRTRRGVTMASIAALADRDFVSRADGLVGDGLLVRDRLHLRLSAAGWPLANSVVDRLMDVQAAVSRDDRMPQIISN